MKYIVLDKDDDDDALEMNRYHRAFLLLRCCMYVFLVPSSPKI